MGKTDTSTDQDWTFLLKNTKTSMTLFSLTAEDMGSETRQPNINFTIEFEENHEIPFLDVRVKRNLNTFTTTVHRKTTFTGLYTKWDTFTPRKYKINVIRTLTYRCLRIYSSSSLLQSALFDWKKTLLQNGYPRGVLCYNINHVWTDKRTSLQSLSPLFQRKIYSLSCLF